MSYRIAAIDVHKKMLAVVVADIAVEGEYQFERRKFGATPDELHVLAQWLVGQDVEEIVMESTAQYWRPVWGAMELYWKPARQKREGASKMCGTLHLCQAKSNHGPRGRKNDFADGERMIKRLVAQELVLSFVPDAEQRLWRTVTRRKYQLTRAKEEPTRESTGTGADQIIELCVGSFGCQCAAHVEGFDRRRNRSGSFGHSG
jgi:transposase